MTMSCDESLQQQYYAEYIDSNNSGFEEITYTELQPLQSFSPPDIAYDDKENNITYLNPLLPVFLEAPPLDRPFVTSYFSLSSDDGFIAKLATIDKPSYTPILRPRYEYDDLNDSSNDSFNSSSISTNANLNSSSIDFNNIPEIDTKDIAEKVLKELRKHNIPQHKFARKVLCRSQGTLSDLLRNPKPWSKMKNGRETFHKLLLWLEKDEDQRIKYLLAND